MPDLAEIFRSAGEAYRDQVGSRILPSQLRALFDIQRCQTSALGGHVWQCDHCAVERFVYHSCRNRHCPRCQHDRAERWLATCCQRLVPCDYYLMTFTLPAELRPVARSHQKLVYGVLLREAASSVLTLTSDPKYLGAKPLIVAILHTWTRALLYHPHVHLLVSAGGMSPDATTWVKPANPAFLVPGLALQAIFRARVRDALARAAVPLLDVPDSTWIDRWVVNVKRVGDGARALQYLARYLFRVAITNNRIERFEDGRVTFSWVDSKSGQTKRCSLDALDFIARFLQHTLPSGFVKLRYYGLAANACRNQLSVAHSILQDHPAALSRRIEPPAKLLTPSPAALPFSRRPCPACKIGLLVPIRPIPPTRDRGPP
jgi:Putative transposase/Transposase zinc-binding domain